MLAQDAEQFLVQFRDAYWHLQQRTIASSSPERSRSFGCAATEDDEKERKGTLDCLFCAGAGYG